MTDSAGKTAVSRTGQRLRLAAWLALAIHLIAGVAMLVVLRHGLETNPSLADRVKFIAENTQAWRWAWFSWNVSAISMFLFTVAMTKWLRAVGVGGWIIGRGAVALCAMAVSLDLSAEMIEMWALPGLASRIVAHGVDGELGQYLVMLHRLAVVMTGVAANGLYTTVALLLTIAACRMLPTRVTLCGLGVGVAGYALSTFAALDLVNGMFWANVFLVPCILTWLAGVGLYAPRLLEPECLSPHA